MTQSNIEVRVARLEAIEAIRALKLTYAGFCDTGYSPDKIGPLFTEDAVWDGGVEHFGVYHGRSQIEEFFGGVSGEVTFAMHYMIGGTIDVHDDLRTATGKWYLWEPITQIVDGEATSVWVMGTYEDRYVLEDGTWKFAHVKITFESIARADRGWHKERFLK